ncbi:2,5-dihydroxypyridine 5,6-dioxygenase [Ramlibacter sp. AW1]|uniref:2,5-dihydroxypyridine 5,6-dioxygenase n=1 Tax=Ramlibacter aurantiacus TaxID=2801330 RepID=A0A936ZQH4_9BURK|nr:2,5-dihydroxypyridine 5,6-dioxygenase [Ramlibacter aurantiacus]MBL0421846.1 2,5-dihydroxypyridine 5,6-dioxygenase [Ramlibacter aurantiacus]
MYPAAIRTQELNPAKLTRLFRTQFERCNVKPGETIALISDLGTRREFVQSSFAAADELGADVYEMCVNSIPSWSKVGVPTIGRCKGTLEAAKQADLIVIFHVPLFSSWLKDVRDAGTRVLMIIDAPDDLEQLMSPEGLKEAVLHAHARLERAREIRVTSEAGTDFTYRCGDYPVMSQYGFAESPGRFDHWGAGHVHTFPNEGSANGRVVVQPGDMVILPYCRYVQDRVEIEVREGFITRIEGGLDAKLMDDWLAEAMADPDDRDPYAISHLGWGLNPQSRWHAMALNGDDPERNRASARTFPGNFLFSTGPNTQGGGTRKTRGHLDVPMRDCTVVLDGETVIERGKLVDPKMRVPREPR